MFARMRLLLPLGAALVALAACTPLSAIRTPAPADTRAYDLVIAGGKIVDGTGNAWFYGDVGIIGDRIARTTHAGMLARVPARRRIDARGLVVAPGVIDIQAHSEEQLLAGDSRASLASFVAWRASLTRESAVDSERSARTPLLRVYPQRPATDQNRC